jgi:hypothetical protein
MGLWRWWGKSMAMGDVEMTQNLDILMSCIPSNNTLI